jgi:hypothetical protein
MKRFYVSLFLLVASMFATITAQAQVTSLSITGFGQPLFLTPADGSFSAFTNFDNGVSVSFFGSNHFFFLDFSAPNNGPLTVGTYTAATRFPFQAPTEPGLDVSGDGFGCNTLTGSFTVLEAAYDANGVVSFDATFEQFCGSPIPIAGEVRFNAHQTVSITPPSHLTVVQNQTVNFTVTATDAESRHVALSASGVPAGATFVDNGDNTGTFNWTPSASQTGDFFVTFRGDNLSGNTGLAVTQISVIPLPPPNDDFNAPTVIPSMPFTVSENITNATTAPDDPFCVGHAQTVWFAFTPAQNMRIEANTFGSNYDTTLSVYTGSRGSLTQLACNDDSVSVQSRIRFDAVAGTTYYFMVSSFSFFSVSNANLVFNLVPAPPPLAIAPSVIQFGSVDPSTGAASISGFVSCSQPAFVTISGQLKQTHGPASTFGFFSVFVPCNGTTPWSTSIQTVGQTFHGRALADLFTGGPADVTASASAFDFENGVLVQRDFAVRINLRGKP